MMLRSAFLLFLLLKVSLLPGQNIEDTIQLDEIRVYGMPLKEYTAGSKIKQVDSAALKIYASNNVAELLSQRSPLYFKTYGVGMVSTVSFRGTSASHTAVLWNGVNINSASLGQNDFSTLPVAAFENISILYGSSSALYGSGAIGGAVHLYSDPEWENGYRIGLQQEIGSFGRYYTGASAKFGNGKFESKTSVFLKNAENDFPYNIKTFDGIKEVRQKNAELQQKGIIQDLSYRFRSNQYLSLNLWYNYLDREIQPSVSSSDNQDHQLDENIRVVANYHLNNQWGHSNPRLAYLYDVIEFNDDPSYTYRYIAALQHELKINEKLKIGAGVDFTHIVAAVNGYGEEKNENRTDIFFLAKYSPLQKLAIALNIRQAYVTGFSAPLAPSLGLEYELLKKNHLTLKWKGNISRSYRVPTLNDRYWSPGGNKDLRSETGLAYEAGLALDIEKEQTGFSIELTGYFNNVDDWIIWLKAPGESFWSPENIDKVHARGIEVGNKWSRRFGNLSLSAGLSYAFTKSTHEQKTDKKYGQQLMYVPLHSGAFHAGAEFQNWFMEVNTHYTGTRFTTIDKLDPFWLSGLVLGKNLNLGIHQLSALLKINNLLDNEYFNYESRAMPGRNYNLTIKYTLNK